jgi:AraC family transcriptional regulator of adaptative response / DNA-3-methyladenine glycosylase II
MTSSALHPVRVRLSAAAPWSPSAALGHVVATGVPGCEEARAAWYRRTVTLPGGPGILAVHPTDDGAECRLWLHDENDEPAAVSMCRRVLDLDDDPAARPDPSHVVAVLAHDPALRPVVERTPGQRLPRSVDARELAVRAVLGQQVSTAAARTLARRLLLAHGSTLPADPAGGLTHLWPTPQQLVAVDEGTLGMPSSRRRSLVSLVRALAEGTVDLSPGADLPTARAQLAGLPGIGPWTVELVALRGLGDADAFPATDLGVRRAAESLGLPAAPAALAGHAERWRPYRAYAVQYLWSTLDHEVNREWRAAGGAA